MAGPPSTTSQAIWHSLQPTQPQLSQVQYLSSSHMPLDGLQLQRTDLSSCLMFHVTALITANTAVASSDLGVVCFLMLFC